MTQTPKILAVATLALATALPASAAHNNPWATAEDIVNQQFHDDNQARSIDTPGEDEMRGVMVRAARGKLDPDRGNAAAGQGRGPQGNH